MNTTPLGPGQEFDRIRSIATAVQDILGPIGNDTAAVPSGDGQLVVSTDASVENVHFRRDWITPEEIGWRATASALSDLAAAGATATGITVAVVSPPDAHDADLVHLMQGVAGVLRANGGLLLGGDLSAGPVWMVAVTVFGHADRPVLRSGAAVGNRLWVTGVLGGARAAVASWMHGIVPSAPARLAFARPQPRLAAGRWLAKHGATAMIDISDGLGGDAAHLAAASVAGVSLVLDALPVHPGVIPVAPLLKQAPALFAALGGEDYELLVAMPADWNDPSGCEAETGVRLTLVGEMVDTPGTHFTLHAEPVVVIGFSHRI